MEGCVGLKPLHELIVLVLVILLFGLTGLVVLVFDTVRKGAGRIFGRKRRDVMPDVLRNSEYGQHEFVRLPRTRLKLHYVISGPADKPLMLFAHGFPEFWYSWRHQLKEFSKDYRVVAFDMRGYGESDKPSGICQYTVDKLADDIDQLITELGYNKCILVAHDWGGAVAWGYAALHPDRVSRLIICNIPHPVTMAKYLKSNISQLFMSWYIFFFQVPVLPQLFMLSDDLINLEQSFCGKHMGAKQGTLTAADIEAYKYTFSTYESWCGPINFYRAALRYESPAVYAAYRRGKLTMPTLIVWGTKDAALSKEMAQLSSQRVEQCTVKYIEGASHWVQQEEPQQVNRFIRSFLEDTVPD